LGIIAAAVEAEFQAATKAVKEAKHPDELETAQRRLHSATVRKQALGA